MLQKTNRSPQVCCKCENEVPELQQWQVRDFSLRYATGYCYREGGSKLGWKVEALCDRCKVKCATLRMRIVSLKWESERAITTQARKIRLTIREVKDEPQYIEFHHESVLKPMPKAKVNNAVEGRQDVA